jgi:hypothetical protein
MQDDKLMAAELANTMWNSLKGRPVLVLLFISLVPSIYVCKRRV